MRNTIYRKGRKVEQPGTQRIQNDEIQFILLDAIAGNVTVGIGLNANKLIAVK